MSVSVSPKANLNLLFPSFAEKVSKLLELARAINLPILITDGLRNKEEQDKLYAKGRTESGKIVTNAKYPDSAHNWAIAVDFCKNVKGEEYTDDKFFTKVGEFAESLGFEWAGRWVKFKELCHLQDKDFNVSELKSKYGTLENFLKTWSGGQ